MRNLKAKEVVVKTRHDAWTLENDKLLAETVLSYVQNGQTQTAAFEVVGKQLNRTASACGYRWNATVRKKYTVELDQIKKRRKETPLIKKKNNAQEVPKALQHVESSSTIENKVILDVSKITKEHCIRYLSQMPSEEELLQLLNENKRLKEENKKLYKTRQDLHNRCNQLDNQKQKIDHKHKTLIGFINQAQTMSEEKQLYH